MGPVSIVELRPVPAFLLQPCIIILSAVYAAVGNGRWGRFPVITGYYYPGSAIGIIDLQFGYHFGHTIGDKDFAVPLVIDIVEAVTDDDTQGVFALLKAGGNIVCIVKTSLLIICPSGG